MVPARTVKVSPTVAYPELLLGEIGNFTFKVVVLVHWQVALPLPVNDTMLLHAKGE